METTHHWNACIESILGILEDRLVRYHDSGTVTTKQSTRKTSRHSLYSASCWKIPVGGNQPIKRKRSAGVDMRDRKILRTSSTGSSLILRDINRQSTTDIKSTPSATSNNKYDWYHQTTLPMKTIPIKNLATKKHHFNISSNTKSKLDQWLHLQTQHTNDNSAIESNTVPAPGIDISQHALTDNIYRLELEINNTVHQLKSTSIATPSYSQQQYLLVLKNGLAHFSSLIRKWLDLSSYKSIQTLFPDWSALEDYIYGMMNYIKAHEIIYQNQLLTVSRTDDLLGDIHYIQSILDDSSEFLGTQLATDGCLWKEMGWWVDQGILDVTKQQFLNICIGLQDELSNEISKNGYTEKVMECIVCGMELMASVNILIGRSLDQENIDFCRPLVVLYAQWISREIQSHGQQHYKSANRTSRTDLRILQLVNNMTRVLTAFDALTNLSQLENNNNSRMGTLASLLVEIVFNVVSIIDQQALTQTQPYIKRSNIMRNAFLPTLYLEQSLVTFADGVVELSDQKTQGYTKRIKWLYSLFD